MSETNETKNETNETISDARERRAASGAETLADISHYMRNEIPAQCNGKKYWGSRVREILHEYADRIEAAANRERNASPVGNAAAMREALEKIHLIASTNINECAADKSDVYICEIAKAALSAPPRNCDRFKAERAARNEWWKTEVLPIVHGVAVGKVNGHEPAYVDWLFMSAKEG